MEEGEEAIVTHTMHGVLLAHIVHRLLKIKAIDAYLEEKGLEANMRAMTDRQGVLTELRELDQRYGLSAGADSPQPLSRVDQERLREAYNNVMEGFKVFDRPGKGIERARNPEYMFLLRVFAGAIQQKN